MPNGIAQGKNVLGADCLVLGFFFFWYLLQIWQTEWSTKRNELWLIAGFLFGICWVLRLGAQCHIYHCSLCSDNNGRVCRGRVL